MSGLALLIPIALGLGALGLLVFFWAMRNGQFEDLDGAAQRILIEEEEATVVTELPAALEPASRTASFTDTSVSEALPMAKPEQE